MTSPYALRLVTVAGFVALAACTDGFVIEEAESALAGECTCPTTGDNFCSLPPRTAGCAMTHPGGYCDPNGDGSYADADWNRGYYEVQDTCSSCPCVAHIDNECHRPPGTAHCGMTAPGGYCDPNGDGSYSDADWERGYDEFVAHCPVIGPVVAAFYAEPTTVDRGGTVSIIWRVSDDAVVGVNRLNPVGQIAEFVSDPGHSGTWTLALPDYYVDRAGFYLAAIGDDGARVDRFVTVTVRCALHYFFGFTPEGETCPAADDRPLASSFEPFEGGFMLWHSTAHQILVLKSDGHLQRYDDDWRPSYVQPPAGPPPSNRFAPSGRFGKLWAERPEVRAALGWATAIETSYTARIQASGQYRYARTYVSLPDDSVVYWVEDTWGQLD